MAKKQEEHIIDPIFNVVYDEYQKTTERSRSFDTRAGIFITFLMASFPLYLQIIDIRYIKNQLSKDLFSFVEVTQLLFFFGALALFICAFILLACVMSTRKYWTYDTSVFEGLDINEYRSENATSDDINVQLIADFNTFILYNIAVVDKKAKLFTVALWLSCAYVIATIISIILIIL